MARQREPKNITEPHGLGLLMRPAREQRGWSQADLGEILGIDKSFVSAIEVGARKWPRKYVKEIADALGLDLVEMAIVADMLPEDARRTRLKVDTYPVGDPARDVIEIMDEMDYMTRVQVREFAWFLVEKRKKQAAD